MSSDPFQQISLAVNGKSANGKWSYDEAGGLTIEAEWGPGPKQRCTIEFGNFSLLELHYATLAGAARALSDRRQAARSAWHLNGERNGGDEVPA